MRVLKAIARFVRFGPWGPRPTFDEHSYQAVGVHPMWQR